MKKRIVRQWAFVNDRLLNGNGVTRLEFRTGDSADQKLEAAYRLLGVSYPKFFKMDAQSKLGWLCAEFMTDSGKFLEGLDKKQLALVLSNSKASLDTDEQYEASLHHTEEFLPSPSVFVYTLANIVAGEICIRHGIKGENNFLIRERFDAENLYHYVTMLFDEGLCNECIVGWVEAYRGSLRAVMAQVEEIQEAKDGRLFSIDSLNQLYQTSEL